jgi:hypothetical protein
MPSRTTIHFRLLLAALAAGGLAGCWSVTGKRRPLFGGDDPAGGLRTQAPEGPPARERQEDAPEAALLRDLKRAGTDDQRKRIADALVARGAGVRPLVERARDEEGVVSDLLDDVLRRLDVAATGTATATLGPVHAVDAGWVEEKYGLALDRYLSGDTYGALRLIDAILALEPGTAARPRLLRLRRRARDRLVRESVVVADIIAGAPTIVPSEPVRARVRLTNVGQEPLVVRVADGALGVVTVEYEELSQDGRRTRTQTERRVPAPRELRLEPGKAIELPVELPAPHARLPARLVGRIHLGGWLRAQTLLVGDASYPYFVPLLPADVLVVHPADLELSKDPRAAFHAAVQAGQRESGAAQAESARRAFVAALLVAREDAEAAVELVATTLEARDPKGPVCDALCAALARATGEPLGFTREEWLRWWHGRRSRPERLREEREARQEEEAGGDAESPGPGE